MLRRHFVPIAAWAVLASLPALAADTALDRYVRKPDPTYSYRLVNSVRGDGYTSYVIELTSQTWRQASEVDRPVWKHWLTIVKPDRVASTTGYLFISGGSVTAGAPAETGPVLRGHCRRDQLNRRRIAGRAQRAAPVLR